MKVHVEMDEKEIRAAIVDYIDKKSGMSVPPDAINIQVKSKQNYKSEWETATFKANFDAYNVKGEF